jgi:hypothetical protein
MFALASGFVVNVVQTSQVNIFCEHTRYTAPLAVCLCLISYPQCFEHLQRLYLTGYKYHDLCPSALSQITIYPQRESKST